MKHTISAFAAAGLVSSVAGHGFITSPQARMPGSAMAAACGQQVEVNQASDNYGNIQGMLQVANGQSDYDAAACDIWLCKGYKFYDNKDNVQTFTAGETVPIVVDIRAPHTGSANVSIVKTATNTVIGDALKSWDVYASTASTIPDDQKNFDITIPSDIGSECATAGECVIQWFWDARSIDQTYESCIDFTVGASGDSSNASSSAAPATSATLAPSSVAASSVVAFPSSSSVAASSVAVSSVVAVAETSQAVATSTVAASSATPTPSALIPTSAIPSALLTSTIPAGLPTGTATPKGLKPLPAGTTFQDILDWINYFISTSLKKRHARDIAIA